MNESIDTQSALKKEVFDLHISFLTDLGKSLMASTAGVVGFLLGAIGWIASADDAQTFLSSHVAARWGASLAVAATAVLFSGGLFWIYSAGHRTYASLVELNYLPESSFRERRISQASILICALGVVCISSLLILIVWV